MPTEIETIMAQRQKALDEIAIKISRLIDDDDAIVNAARAANRPYTRDEKAKLKEIRTGLVASQRADRDVRLIAIESLNNSTTLKQLLAGVEATNKELKEVFDDLKKVSETIKNIAEVVGKIAQVINGLKGLLAGLP
jgi:hypothetical protein